MTQGERALRRMLWLRHGHSALYGDDGEMQCQTCMIDFLRENPITIERKLNEFEISSREQFNLTE